MDSALLSRGIVNQTRVGPEEWHIRKPDYTEQKEGHVLQIWGDEGYWHIVDPEAEQLLEAVREPRTLADLLLQHPDWKRQKGLVTQTLQRVSRGLVRAPTPRPPQIENVSINLTTACNLHCTTCYVPVQDRAPTRLDSAAAIAFLERLGTHLSRTASISLLGGEPFMHAEGVLALARWARKRRHTCNVSTNGTVSLQHLAPQLRGLRVQVQVSVDGACAQTNDALRGPGTFEKALHTTRALIAAGVHTTLCMVACRENQAGIEDYLHLAHRLGANEARIIPLKRLGNAKSGGPTPAPQVEIVQAVAAALARNPPLEGLCRSDLYAILRSLVKDTSHRRTCGSGTQTLLLQANGELYPCINNTMAQARLGTMTGDPDAILEKGAEWGNLLSLENASHPCHGCVVKRWCLAGCPGETIQREGNLKHRHWSCADLQNAIIYMMWHSGDATPAERTSRTRI